MSEITFLVGSTIEAIYSDEAADVLEELGNVSIRRVSHVEPEHGNWFADMGPIGGPKLGPYSRRSDAIDAEIAWLKENRGL
jgi:hypothetical protein